MVQTTVKKSFNLRNHSIDLFVSPNELFTPNMTTKLFTKAVQINEGDIVFDIGSGVGPLAIWAALEPSQKVHAVEVVKEQYQLAIKNIISNRLQHKIILYNGKFFEPIHSEIKADVIIADVSGISESIARSMSTAGESWYPETIPTGGRDGTEMICGVLERANDYLNENGRLYFPVASLSNHEKIEKIARRNFTNLEVIIQADFPLEPGQKEIIERVGEQGTYTLGKKGSRDTWRGWIYKASN